MRHAQLTCLLAFCLCGFGIASGCGGDGADPCARAETRLRQCSMLSDGEFNCARPDDVVLAHCSLDCMDRAPCDEVAKTLCLGTDTDMTSCVQRCVSAAEARAASSDAPSEFACADGSGIPQSWRCDGEADCRSGNDEQGCPPGTIFECDDGTSIPGGWECDGDLDCRSGIDEEGCPEMAELICE